MAHLGNIGAGISIAAGGVAAGGVSLIGASLRTSVLGVSTLVTDAGLASGIPNPVVVDASAAVGVVQPPPSTITGVVG